ncbi:MAG: hypothetical protein P1V97_28715, partial [Planctomycetota bacterium]|nr:hypothetical protein [Planctomycetota bacterium]
MTRADTPEGCLKKLSGLFTSLEETQRMGTLKLSSSNNQMVYVYFNSGFIEYIKTNRHKTLLGRALVKRRKLSETQLKAALHRQNEAPRPVRLGQILVDGGLVTRDDIQKALAFQMAEEIFACFRWEQFTDVFYRGEPPLDIFQEEDREFRVALRPAQLAQEAERRARELRTVRKLIPSDHDVCVITTDSQLLGDGSGERELIGFIDGRRDVEEFLEALPAPDFLGLRILSKLLSNGHAARLDGDQLVKLGQECEEASDYNRAKKRYLRASEIGHSDFELSRRIGQIEEVLGHSSEAVSRYRAYAEQCERHEIYEV